VVAACARETRLVFLLEADTEGRERESLDAMERRGAVKTAAASGGG